ncbi:hydrogenase large subunit [Candidatus Nitrospira bockiana]
MNAVLNVLEGEFGEAIACEGRQAGAPVLRVTCRRLPDVVGCVVKRLDGLLSLLWALDAREPHGRYDLYYLFTLLPSKQWLLLHVELPANTPDYPSITPQTLAAKWYEREIKDLFGLVAVGHPDLRRLVRHEHWPEAAHPLRKDVAWDCVLDRHAGGYRFRRIEGEGVFEVPVGPIHAGIIEPGHFRFSVAGEPIMQLELRHFWKHRGVEKLFEQRSLLDGVSLAERVSGDTTIGHGLAYCQAVEALYELDVPRRARYLRTLLLELERLHNHLGDVGAICHDTAYAAAHAHCSRLKERVLQLNDRLFGSRFLRGALCVGGVTGDLERRHLAEIAAESDRIAADFGELEAILFANASLVDRLETTGVLTEDEARRHAAVGVVGRASGIDRDLRRDRPFAAYDELTVNVVLYRYGDVRARFRVRVDEIHESIRLLREATQRIPDGPHVATGGTVPAKGRWAVAAVEGWRGEILYAVHAGAGGAIERCKVRDPSFVNWPSIQQAVLGNIVPDFPLINKSFNLSYAGNDL